MISKKVFSHEMMPLVKEFLSQNQDVFLTVSGTSMKPFFEHQKTTVKLGKPSTPFKKYDVVLYEDHLIYKLHRILKIKDNTLVICGDGLTQLEWIQDVQVFGIVNEHEINEKTIKKDNKNYLLKVRLWSLLRPFRKYILKLIRS